MTRRHILIGLSLLGAAVASVGWSGVAEWPMFEAAPPPVLRPLTVETLTAEQVSTYSRERRYTGRVVARRASDLSFERAGTVVNLLVDDGDEVDRDQILARLDTRKLAAQRRRIEAERDRARARLRELENGEREEVIRRARADVAELEAEVTLNDAAEATPWSARLRAGFAALAASPS